MRPALSEQVNNELEAVYFIDKVYRLDPLLYEKCTSSLKEYKEYFAQPEQLGRETICSPGEFTKGLILKKFSGHDVPARRTVFRRIKEHFKHCWFAHAGYPPLPLSAGGVTEFKKAHIDEFSQQTLSFPRKQRDMVISYAYYSASSSAEILWIDAAGAATEEEMKAALRNSAGRLRNADEQQGLLCDIYNRLFSAGKGVIIIEHAPYLGNEKNREVIYKAFAAASLSPASQLVLIEQGEEVHGKVTEGNATEGEKPAHVIKPIVAKNRFIYIAAITVFAAAVLLFIYIPAQVQPVNGVLLLRYFGDEVEQDPFSEGMILTWINEEGEVIGTETLKYNDVHPVSTTRKGAGKILLSKGAYEIHPDTILVRNLYEDTLVVMFYRLLSSPDVITDSILNLNAQRWYTFTQQDSSYLSITCEALSDGFSPQMAVYMDRLGKNRLLPNDNILGDKKNVSLNGALPPGKYYIKVRGYDRTTGKYRLNISKTAK